jgi:hypothetical protein
LVAKTREEDLVRSIEILRKKLAGGFGFLHARRQEALWRAVDGLMLGGRLWLTALGRDMRGPAREKHRIKAADRLLGNVAIHRAQTHLYRALAAWLLRGVARPVVLVDWTGCGPGQYVLRAGLPFCGRAILLCARVVPKEKLANRAVHAAFLRTLATIIPQDCTPVIVTDAGFHRRWFEQVRKLGWDFVGRIRGRFHVRAYGKKMPLKELFCMAGAAPIDLGVTELGANRADLRRLVLSARPQLKGRKRLTRRGKRGQRQADRQHSSGAKEPLLLATSLACPPKAVVEIYTTRMQIEESFRDLKSHRFGWSFSDAKSRHPRRLEVLMIIATLASVAMSMVGVAAERRNLQRQFQANTLRKRRVLSLINLGRRVIHASIEFSAHELRAALAAVQAALQAVNPLQAAPI